MTTTATTTEQERLRGYDEVSAFCREHNLPAKRVGKWIWCKWPEGEKPNKELRELMKAAGFFFNWNRKEWGHNCGVPSRRGKGNPRAKYGEDEI